MECIQSHLSSRLAHALSTYTSNHFARVHKGTLESSLDFINKPVEGLFRLSLLLVSSLNDLL